MDPQDGASDQMGRPQRLFAGTDVKDAWLRQTGLIRGYLRFVMQNSPISLLFRGRVSFPANVDRELLVRARQEPAIMYLRVSQCIPIPSHSPFLAHPVPSWWSQTTLVGEQRALIS